MKSYISTFAMLCLSMVLFISAKPISKNKSLNVPRHSAPVLLQKVELLFATPVWGDGKNDDNSDVHAKISIFSSDGNVYIGFGDFGDASGIPKNGDRIMPIVMSGGINQLDNSTILKVEIEIGYKITSGRLHSDHWDVRRELSLTFADGTVKYSGYNDPAYKVDFEDDSQEMDGRTYDYSKFFNKRTLVPPYN